MALFALFVAYHGHQLVGLFIVFGHRHLTVILFVGLVALLIGFFGNFFTNRLLAIYVFSPVYVHYFLHHRRLLVGHFRFLFRHEGQILLNVRHEFGLAGTVVRVFTVRSRVFVVHFSVISRPPAVTNYHLGEMGIRQPTEHKHSFANWRHQRFCQFVFHPNLFRRFMVYRLASPNVRVIAKESVTFH